MLCLISSGYAEAGQQVLEGPARVIDGDTLEVNMHAVKYMSTALAFAPHMGGGLRTGVVPSGGRTESASVWT